MSPDTVSSLFPDRPIRPLPTRRLRERLSPEVANSIKYPPATLDSIPLFYYPHTAREGNTEPNIDNAGNIDHGRRAEGGSGSSRRSGIPCGEGEEDAALRSTLVTRSPPEILNRTPRHQGRQDQRRHGDPQPPPSTNSSVDGYESFENTNNKKRKIPSAGDSNFNGGHSISSDISSLAISAGGQMPAEDGNGQRSYPTSATFPGAGPYLTGTQGMSGSGRGRLSRSKSGRSPLRTLSDANNSWLGRAPKTGPQQWPSARLGNGIISNAIANAEKLPAQEQENVSLLQQSSSSGKTTPASTQFTFTCESQVPGNIQWPGHPARHNMGPQAAAAIPPPANPNNATHPDGSAKGARGGSANSRRKTRQRLEKELGMAARHRQQLAFDNYCHNPPRMEDVWVCEFCEYERIFGEPPRALIRDYEIKDRRHRQEEADRKRLLEKAKAKSRKGKKAGKAGAWKGNAAGNTHPDQAPPEHPGDHQAPPMHLDHSHSTQSEEDYEYECDEGCPRPPPDRNRGEDDGGGEQIPSRAKT